MGAGRGTIYFRCDAGLRYGLGHIMRCIALAQGFQKKGFITTFLVRKLECADLYRILLEKDNFHYIFLDDEAEGLECDLGGLSGHNNSTIVIFDNYDVTTSQMVEFKKKYSNLIAIDDMADRDFCVDLIINQNINAESLVYKTMGEVRFLLGTRYVLLRDDVLRMRKKENSIRHDPFVFMSFGGGDTFSRIKHLLGMFHHIDQRLESPLRILWALPADAAQIEKIEGITSDFKKIKIEMISGNYELASIMKDADFAITAAGTSVFELAFLGVPQIVFIIDDNQEVTGRKVNEKGFGTFLGRSENAEEKEFIELFFEFLRNRIMRQRMSKKGKAFIDGRGVERVVDHIMDLYQLT
ncbi:MAG: UDP-2,4-diacetamido-2,4,6-trideoxy-beta-L-altropyranose hydrolase [bacterium]